MNDRPSFLWHRLEGQWGSFSYQLTRVQFSSEPTQRWAPAINAYRCRDGFLICVELAGLERTEIDVQVEPRRLFVRGERALPGPDALAGPALQVLAMEIDNGPFSREVVLPDEVEPGLARAEQRNGLLWITLPLRSPGGAT